MVVSIENAEHYIWGEVSDGWHLLKRAEVSIIQERVPAGRAEVMHYHTSARQFFYILQGEGTMVFDDHQVVLHPGDGWRSRRAPTINSGTHPNPNCISW